MTATVFDSRICALGEGPLWHPLRNQLFWFDILGSRLLTQSKGEAQEWVFDEHVSAAGWIDRDTLMMASETGLYKFDLNSGERELIVPLEADNKVTRSNDGRADPQGGFWIGTMGFNAEEGEGAIYRYYRGELRQLFADITISNAICFAPSGDRAYFCDTVTKQVMTISLDATTGWPLGHAEVFVDLNQDNLNPDGAVVDSQGNVWIAQWGAHRVACYASDGTFLREAKFEAEQVSCPAFGGPALDKLFATTAAVGLSGDAEGQTYVVDLADVRGQPEHQVIL